MTIKKNLVFLFLGVGHWLVAHRETMEQRGRDSRRTRTNGPGPSAGSDCSAAGNTLDGSLLVNKAFESRCVTDTEWWLVEIG